MKKQKIEQHDGVPERYLKIVQSFSNSPDDIIRWREERKRRFPKSKLIISSETTTSGLSSLASAYASSSEEDEVPQKIEEDSKQDLTNESLVEITEKSTHQVANNKQQQICKFFQRTGKCKYGNKCRHIHGQTTSNQQQPASSSSSYHKSKNKTLTLYKTLVQDEIERESEILLDAIHFIVSKNFFQDHELSSS